MKNKTNFSFAGKHVLLTGAGGGLGKALAGDLAEMGAELILSDRSDDSLSDLIALLPDSANTTTICADLSIPEEAKTLASKAIAAGGHIDVIINNAGIAYHALMEETIETKIQQTYQVNTFSPLVLIKELLPNMKQRRFGIIINILSCAGFIPTPTTGIYGGSKFAFSAMARVLRLELAPDGIKVINIYPGPIDTSFNENAFRENDRPGVYACGTQGANVESVSKKILSAVSGPPADVWLDRKTKWLSIKGMFWQNWTDRNLASMVHEHATRATGHNSTQERTWKLWQLETSIACNLNCRMCPWKKEHQIYGKKGDMSENIWRAIRPYLSETQSIDFSGGGEPLLQPKLAEWIQEANSAGCKTGFLTNGVILNREKISQYLQAGIDWIGFSLDGATSEIYEKIREGADFNQVCKNIAAVSEQRSGNAPIIVLNFVMMSDNINQVEDIVHLAAKLGVDKINFKQCDVIRGSHGKNYGLFVSKETRKIRRWNKNLKKARHLAKKCGIETTAFSFIPDELPVCAQDPRDSLFIRHDGLVAPCINLANGGPSSFLGKEVTIPTVHYGSLKDQSLKVLWETESCRFYRNRFEKRVQVHDSVIGRSSFEASLIKLEETLTAAKEAMPTAPQGCNACHYLYNI